MTVTLVAPGAQTWNATSTDGSTAAAIAATRATTFVRTQAQWLRRGLEHADDDVALAIVLAAHDRAHERWVAQIHAVSRVLGEASAQHLAALYGYAGRVAGSLEARSTQLLPAEVATVARQLAADRLSDLTEQAVEALWQAAATV